MAAHLRIANSGTVHRSIGDWTDTETARDIRRSLELVRVSDGPALTMIAGSPGIGKTLAVKRFCKELGEAALYIQATCGEGTVWNLANYMASLWGPGARGMFNTAVEARLLLSKLIGRGKLVVLDEAQYLNQKNAKTGRSGEAYEWLRAMAETGQFSLVFVGDLSLTAAIQKLPQLQSRMVRPVVIPCASRADVASIVEGSDFASPAAIDALHVIAKREGGLRNVENVLRMAILFAGKETPTIDHLRAAIIDMKLGKPGEVKA